ncbi:hypothetical protein IM792_13985 [Mucilaginibacter sp. JRF]|uniref:hypothetical protein n=1 Tax=Mucilaginibacter sp. JRF TaxID=2780088 RepID=UPI001882BB92|nr:hypothetical protein [Mucilaginibacter sp. JRF]MBE9585561.1 hypothetical protein [Mucilaginibacter sp. JRF]
MEKTGISLLSLFSTNSTELSEKLFTDDEESSSSRTESKETVVTEFWLHHPSWLLPAPHFEAQAYAYTHADSDEHLAYFPSVPTPPPNAVIPA